MELARKDLVALSNALNEVLHGPDSIAHSEFATRIGVSRQDAVRLLQRMVGQIASSSEMRRLANEPLTLTCAHCGAPFQVPAHVRALPESEREASGLAVMCADCARDFDQAREDGVYRRLGGRVSLVHALRDGTRLILNENPSIRDVADLIDALQGAAKADVPVADAVHNVAGFGEFEKWARQNPATAKVAGGLLVIILTALATRLASAPKPDPAPPSVTVEITVRRPPESELQRLIDHALQEYDQEEVKDSQAGGSGGHPQPDRAPPGNVSGADQSP